MMCVCVAREPECQPSAAFEDTGMRVARPRPQTLRPTRIPPEYVSPGLYKRIQFVAPVDVLHPLLVVRGLHEGCASEAGLLVLVALVALLVDGDGGGTHEVRRAGLLPCARNKDGQGR